MPSLWDPIRTEYTHTVTLTGTALFGGGFQIPSRLSLSSRTPSFPYTSAHSRQQQAAPVSAAPIRKQRNPAKAEARAPLENQPLFTSVGKRDGEVGTTLGPRSGGREQPPCSLASAPQRARPDPIFFSISLHSFLAPPTPIIKPHSVPH
jgi:hypothetical protein